MWQRVFDTQQADELAEAGLLWYDCEPWKDFNPAPYGYEPQNGDALPSSYTGLAFFIFLEE